MKQPSGGKRIDKRRITAGSWLRRWWNMCDDPAVNYPFPRLHTRVFMKGFLWAVSWRRVKGRERLPPARRTENEEIGLAVTSPSGWPLSISSLCLVSSRRWRWWKRSPTAAVKGLDHKKNISCWTTRRSFPVLFLHLVFLLVMKIMSRKPEEEGRVIEPETKNDR